MGRSSVKKKKSQKKKVLNNKEITECLQLVLDVFDDQELTFKKTEERLTNIETNYQTKQQTTTAFAMHDKTLHNGFYATRAETESLFARTKDIEDKLKVLMNEPIVCYTGTTTKVTENMLNALKNTKPNPVNCTPPKVSKWRNVEERTEHTLRAVKNALRLMRGIDIYHGPTYIIADVRCQGWTREITLNFTSNDIKLVYVRRNGKHISEDYANTTQAAAAFVAVCMYYATR